MSYYKFAGDRVVTELFEVEADSPEAALALLQYDGHDHWVGTTDDMSDVSKHVASSLDAMDANAALPEPVWEAIKVAVEANDKAALLACVRDPILAALDVDFYRIDAD